ncbi:D-alanyl-lipoteichoic acid biosynthesis protein DltB [Anaerosacchariphilus polymeriproducens]|uniref:Teichoic acid D-alanyltransferase n=1 Tax=Anaerosacchariphilus polymeriproducens TaxID=1812858 RepID=A0A371ART9_9FIRM|nr:D-alanyl-lipoteichoic acid biosynthesis protein DltB [Anaerosacchariphilus polymeriproducens]RDU22268.1 D-alanyl-lipoteichoic acid biosynthesis protein DltB [Anaerosacchariphilus polymeriproducens]
MNFFEGYAFFLVLIVLLIPAIIMGYFEKSLKLYSFGISIVFVIIIFSKNWIQLLYLILYFILQLSIAAGYLYLRKKYGRNQKLYHIFLILTILPLVLCKLETLIHINIFGFVGISYLTFKNVQIIIEIYDGVIKELAVFEYASFILFFPTLSSGPIDRSRRFHDDWVRVCKREEYLKQCADGIQKILVGIIYKVILAACFFRLMEFLMADKSWYCIIGYAYMYGFYLFFDFAGYSLMAVGTSYILGIRTPDNFKFPFISKDITDFWNRWHISLSHWFRDFVFSRFIMTCMKKKWFNTRLQKASFGFIVNMFIMGMWHGLTPSYLLYGIYHGVLLALTEIYQKKSKFHMKYKNSKGYKFVSWFITIQLVMFGFFIFSGRLLEIIK